jgi:hypothetical protein
MAKALEDFKNYKDFKSVRSVIIPRPNKVLSRMVLSFLIFISICFVFVPWR